jgi:serine/threonine-protein phosphatase 2A regulatory subunit B
MSSSFEGDCYDPRRKDLTWEMTQVFGDKTYETQAAEEDIVSAISFNLSGNYLALGDKSGRLIIFEQSENYNPKKSQLEYQYLTELQSHIRQFDYLKSTDINEKINNISWLPTQGKNMYTLTTNDKIIKLWKISEKTIKEADIPDLPTQKPKASNHLSFSEKVAEAP